MNIKAYPIAWAQNSAARTAARRWQQRGLLTPAQLACIEAAHPVDYYRPAFFLRLGLFIATLLGIVSFVGFIAVTVDFHFSAGGMLAGSLVAAAMLLALLEMAIGSTYHYRSGVDNALLYSMLVFIASAIAILLEEMLPSQFHADSLVAPQVELLLGPCLAVLVLALVRYADPVVALVTYLAALALLVNLLVQSTLAFLLLPLVVLLAAVGLHIWLRRLSARASYFYYRSSLLVLRMLALATIYLAGNYLVVFSGLTVLQPGGNAPPRVPLAPVFYVLTAVIPVVYLYLGLRRHARLLLVLGLLLLAFSLFTVRHFYHLLPPEVAATLGGAVLLAGALAALRYLRTPRHGLTAAADDDAAPRLNLESFITAQTAHVPAAPAGGFEFGGGHSGGGGAEGRF